MVAGAGYVSQSEVGCIWYFDWIGAAAPRMKISTYLQRMILLFCGILIRADMKSQRPE